MAFLSNFNETMGYYLLGVLNSTFIYYWIKYNVHEYGSAGFRLSNQYVEEMPIPIPNQKDEREITTLVDTILDKKSHNLDTSKEEAKIDKIVYAMYGLTEDEINCVLGE